MKSVKGHKGEKNIGQAARVALSGVSLAIAMFAAVASNSAWATACDSSVASSLQTQAATSLAEQKARIDKAVADNSLATEAPAGLSAANPNATGLGAVNLSCFNTLFNLGNGSFNIPSVDQALQAVGQFAVNSACTAATTALRSATSQFNLSQTMSSGIPGLSVSGSTSASGSGLSLLGSGNNLSTVGNLTGSNLSTSNLTGVDSSVTSTTGTSAINSASSSLKNWVLGN